MSVGAGWLLPTLYEGIAQLDSVRRAPEKRRACRARSSAALMSLRPSTGRGHAAVALYPTEDVNVRHVSLSRELFEPTRLGRREIDVR